MWSMKLPTFIWFNLILVPSFANVIPLNFKMELRLREVEHMI